MTEPDDNAKEGDEFVRLLMRHENEIYRYIVSLLPVSHDADDVMQETATVLWRKFSEFDADRPFLPWARRFAFFEVLKHRKNKGRGRLIFNDDLLESLAADYEDHAPVILARRKALDFCLQKLSRADRQILHHRYSGDATVAELAEKTGQAAHKLYYALEQIRDALSLCIQRQLRKEGFYEG